jgi:hypothetical protein
VQHLSHLLEHHRRLREKKAQTLRQTVRDARSQIERSAERTAVHLELPIEELIVLVGPRGRGEIRVKTMSFAEAKGLLPPECTRPIERPTPPGGIRVFAHQLDGFSLCLFSYPSSEETTPEDPGLEPGVTTEVLP